MKSGIPEDLSNALAGRYALERVVGRGGMATVYEARDQRHDRRVAIKVLHSELSATLGAERFQREIQIAARLTHSHILMLIEAGEAVGRVYYVMPFVEGESLRQRLLREGTLSPPEVVTLVREVAGALDYAHRQGVIHRDIKPENILLQAGHALVSGLRSREGDHHRRGPGADPHRLSGGDGGVHEPGTGSRDHRAHGAERRLQPGGDDL